VILQDFNKVEIVIRDFKIILATVFTWLNAALQIVASIEYAHNQLGRKHRL